MAKSSGEQIWVWLDDPAYGPLQQIGTLSRGDRGSVRFAYEPAWLKHAHAFPLDPELDLTAGEFFPGDSNFGVFMDSCPDRWGQTLMKRREAVAAKEEGRTPKTRHSAPPWTESTFTIKTVPIVAVHRKQSSVRGELVEP